MFETKQHLRRLEDSYHRLWEVPASASARKALSIDAPVFSSMYSSHCSIITYRTGTVNLWNVGEQVIYSSLERFRMILKIVCPLLSSSPVRSFTFIGNVVRSQACRFRASTISSATREHKISNLSAKGSAVMCKAHINLCYLTRLLKG